MAAHQAPLSLGFSRQEHWSGLPFPSPMHESEKWKWSRSVLSDSERPHGLQPTGLLHPWDFPGKSTGVGCHRLLREWALQIGLNTKMGFGEGFWEASGFNWLVVESNLVVVLSKGTCRFYLSRHFYKILHLYVPSVSFFTSCASHHTSYCAFFPYHASFRNKFCESMYIFHMGSKLSGRCRSW